MRYLLLLGCLLLSAVLADSAAPGPRPPFAAQWKKIDALLAKNLTADAAPLVEQLYQQARRLNDSPNYVRALLYKIRLLENKAQDADEKAIALLEAELKTAQFPARPVLHSLLAGLYADYFNEHRYQLYERTQGAAPTTDSVIAVGADPDAPAADGGTGLSTWDAPRLGAAIAGHYRQSVSDEPARQLRTSLAELGDLATGGDTEGRALRPSLYDLLAQRAIAGLQNQELTLTKPEEQFELSRLPAAALFGPAAEFAALKLPAPAADSLNNQRLTLQLLQQLTAQRLSQSTNQPANTAANLAALADIDLQRLDYLHGLIQENPDLAAAYEPALARLTETYKSLPLSTEFIARQAEARNSAVPADPVAAVALARQAEARFPKSRGAARARALRAGIERADISFAAADVVVPGQAWRLDLIVRNVSGLRAAAYRISLAQKEKFNQYDSQTPAARYARVLRAAPAATWTVPVPAGPLDYQPRKLATAAPALAAGYYLVVVSAGDKPGDPAAPGRATAYALLGASELSAVSRATTGGGAEVLVLHRQGGQPLAGVAVRGEYRRYDPDARKQVFRRGATELTTAQGLLRVLAPSRVEQTNEQLSQVRVWRGRDTLLVGNYGYYRSNELDKPETRCFLFTDRAIYRPGQTVFFKGILVERAGSKNRLLTGAGQQVALKDANGDVVQTLSFTTNDFGSFHGSFVLPTGRLNGQFTLDADKGNQSFQVEDYKRPTFFVALDSVPGRPRLGQPLTLTGRATAYAGAPTDGAAVKYRVTRRELWALFDYEDFGGGGGRGGYRPGGGRATKEIAHGTATTDAQGRFSLTFTPPLAPARAGRGNWEPGFYFEITADVTDAAGETRTGSRGLSIGRNPLSLVLNGPALADKQRLPEFRLLGTNATGEALPATGTLRLSEVRYRPNPAGVPGPAPENNDTELPARLVQTLPFDTKAGAVLPQLRAALATLPPGRYRLEARAAAPDSAARARLDFTLYDAKAATVPFATPDWFVAPQDSVRPGEPATVLVGSSEAEAHILVETERAGQLLSQQWLTLRAGEQRRLSLPSGSVDGAVGAGGPLYVHTTQVRDGRLYRHDATVQVAEPPQPLQISLRTFRDKLLPGQRETWRVSIRQADGKPADAELLATLYDQSLDVFRPHGFSRLAVGQAYYPARFEWRGQFGQASWVAMGAPGSGDGPPPLTYPMLRTWNLVETDRFGSRASGVMLRGRSAVAAAPMAAKVAADSGDALSEVVVMQDKSNGYVKHEDITGSTTVIAAPVAPTVDLSAIKTRTDFRETAFWQPALRTDAAGDLTLEFQMPEAVTRWQLLALAHDKSLRFGQLGRQLLTQKQVQIAAQAPRFLRPGDRFTLPARFQNLTDAPTQGLAQLTLLDAATGQDITSQLVAGPAQQPVSAPAHQSAALGWELKIPAGFAPVAVTYRVVAQTSGGSPKPNLGSSKPDFGSPKSDFRRSKPDLLLTKPDLGSSVLSVKGSKPDFESPVSDNLSPNSYSDGEENTLPVLPNRLLITESLPLPLSGAGTRAFELKKLTSTSSPTRQNYSLTLELTPNPAWLAVQSLPYLTEYPYECSEQTFSRLYANLLAAHILKTTPRLKTVLAEWTRQARGGSPAQQNALAGKLAQNQELKMLLLQETPWTREAQTETERLARLTTLFDEARLSTETAAGLAKLQRLQLSGGAWPWFEQMPADRYLSQLLVAGFGKLKLLGAFDASQDPAGGLLLRRALAYVDEQTARDYREALRIQKQATSSKKQATNLSPDAIQALYARSFWPGVALGKDAAPAYAYYRQQAARVWPRQPLQLQGQLALALFRHDKQDPTAALILKSLAQNALHSSEMGMYWKDVQPSYYWQEAPTETQAVLIEAFGEVKNDQAAVDEMKLWLLRQKQVQSWPSTRATADACYALLRRGSNLLASTAPLAATAGGQPVALSPGQAGTGYVKTNWPAAAVRPELGRVVLTKADAGPAFGALYWQYFEDLDKITPAATPLSLERQLYRETASASGPVLERLTAATPLRVGDALVVRLVLRTDRSLEYVHLKDQRAAGLEPINQLSGYRYQNGLGYYESPRDAATNFFLSVVPRGTHVFEYRLRAAQAGDFSGGLSQVQCLYAPEFGANSAGQRLTIVR